MASTNSSRVVRTIKTSMIGCIVVSLEPVYIACANERSRKRDILSLDIEVETELMRCDGFLVSALCSTM